MSRFLVVLVGACALIATVSPTRAASLAEQLNAIVTRNGLDKVTDAAAFVPRLEKQAVRSTDYPATSSTPNAIYAFDFEVGAPVRQDVASSPVFLETADTVGHHIGQVGLSVLYGDANTLDGRSLEGPVSQVSVVIPGEQNVPVTLSFDNFSLASTVVAPSVTYGLSSRWDVNLFVPVVNTTLNVDGARTAQVSGVGNIPVERVHIADTKVAVGDLLARTKYRVAETAWADVALGLSVRLPTGDVDNFQGLGDLTLTPLVILSKYVTTHNLHLNLGFEVNADNLRRSRLRYGAGASLRLHERCSLLLDVIGSSGIEDDTFKAGGFTVKHGDMFVTRAIPFVVPRSDIVDGSVGVNVKLAESTAFFLSALVPFTSDGLRAQVVPAGGVQVRF